MPQGDSSKQGKSRKTTFIEKTQTKVFSTIVKALCLLVLLAGFLPFATVSCGPVFQESISGYALAFGSAEERVAEMSQGNMGLGMGMGPGQLAALNMLAGSNVLLIIAFAGTALLLIVSFGLGRSRFELALALIVPAFSLAVYLHWLGLFSAFTDMFARAAEQGESMMMAGPDTGLYAVIAFSVLLLLAALFEAIGKLPDFLTKGEESENPPVAPAAIPAVPQMVMQQIPVGMHQSHVQGYQPVPQQHPQQQQQQSEQQPQPQSQAQVQTQAEAQIPPIEAAEPAQQAMQQSDNPPAP
ncbi:MAG: hypothetical protein FWC86_01000 [Coriobacteriia bacterium]|nr:hypothetical protein [Coriobacteriia bacterium]